VGNAKTGRVRVALAIDAPPATAFFENASVLLIGETNRLSAQFSPPAVAARSRLRIVPDLTNSQEETPQSASTPENKDQPARITYRIAVPATAVAGDTAQLSIEADGIQLSHSRVHVLPPAALSFEDAVAVRVATDSFVPLSPATVPVNQRSGREIVITLRNNAPEIRTFDVTLSVPGLEFSPETLTVSVGASVARNITFRIFSSAATPGVHEGQVRLSGATTLAEPVRFVVLPPTGAVTWSSDGFSILESAKYRASFLADWWLEMIDKDSGNDTLPAGGIDRTKGRANFPRLEELEQLASPKPTR
jgi:hypothetical protein